MPVDEQASKLSVQEQEPASDYGGLMFGVVQRPGDLLPAWGSPEREVQLRRLKLACVDTIVGGSFAGFKKRVQSTPWEIKGGRNLTNRFQRLFQNAQMGKGWDVFVSRLLDDYLHQDKGAFIEVIGGGEPNRPLSGAVEGVAHLDSLRCVLTGNDDFPVVYSARRTGKLHRLHWTRVVHLVDSPDADENYFNLGHSALSRLVSLSTVQTLIQRYHVEKLSDLPPAGFMTISGGFTDLQFQQAMALYDAERTQEGNNIFRNIVRLMGIDPDKEVKVNLISFSELPDQFNYREFVELHVNMIALALGVDVQELWQLTGGTLGTGTQSKVLAEKSRGKGYGQLLQMLERAFNTSILPEALEFKFKFSDTEKDQSEAERAKLWVEVASSVPGLSDEQKLQLLANNVEQIAEVALDEDGQIKLPDVDVKPADQNTEVTANDDAPNTGEPPTGDAITATDDTPQVAAPGRVERHRRGRSSLYRFKAIQATRLDFERDLEDMLTGAVAGTVTRTRAGIILRALIAKYGRQAFTDGLRDGGVEDDPSDDELGVIAKMAREQSSYVTNMLDTLYEDGLTDAEVDGKPSLWWRGSMVPFYQEGLLLADANGMYEFTGSDGKESCGDCPRLKGQRHRYKAWSAKNLVPRIGMATECGGWECEHTLKRTTGKSRGRW